MVKDYLTTGDSGFTLVEILLAIAIVALLGSALLATSGIQAQLAKARDGKRKSDLKKMQNILEDYYNDKGQYPHTDKISCGASFSPYIGEIPCDPQSIKNYLYMSCANDQGYIIYTNLEYKSDPVIAEGECKGGCSVGSLGTYNFGIASPNMTLTDPSNCYPPIGSDCVPTECALPAARTYCGTSGCCPGTYIMICNEEVVCCPGL